MFPPVRHPECLAIDVWVVLEGVRILGGDCGPLEELLHLLGGGEGGGLCPPVLGAGVHAVLPLEAAGRVEHQPVGRGSEQNILITFFLPITLLSPTCGTAPQ